MSHPNTPKAAVSAATRAAGSTFAAEPACSVPSFSGDGSVVQAISGRLLLVVPALLLLSTSLGAQTGTSQQMVPRGSSAFSLSAAGAGAEEGFRAQRGRMVDEQIRRRGVTEPKLLAALEQVPRHLFVPEKNRSEAYEDRPVGLESGQTLPQAYVSARMISLLGLKGGEKVLEIGTGSGYDSALLSQLAGAVHSIEIDSETGARARRLLRGLGYQNVEVHIGDGYRGLAKEAPFDAILVTAAPQRVPEPLFEQLAVGGKMVVAVGFSLHQDLQVITKTADGGREIRRVNLISLAPMTGEINQQR